MVLMVVVATTPVRVLRVRAEMVLMLMLTMAPQVSLAHMLLLLRGDGLQPAAARGEEWRSEEEEDREAAHDSR